MAKETSKKEDKNVKKKSVEIEMEDFSDKEEATKEEKDEPNIKAKVEENKKTVIETDNDNKEESIKIKENIGRKILKVSGVNDAFANHIMQNPKAKNAIMKRAGNVLKNMGVDQEKDLEKLKDEDLKNEIELQSKEVIAQTGRIGSFSKDGMDMRGRSNLHEKYTTKANKMNDTDFQQKAEEALEYENEKDNAIAVKRVGNMLARGSKAIIRAIGNYIHPDKDKPIIKPWQSAIIGLVALLIIPPPAGALVCALMMAKAAKNGLYDGSKLQEWVNEKFFADDPIDSKLNSEVLKDINVKDILESKDKVEEKSVQKKENIINSEEVENKKEVSKKSISEVSGNYKKEVENINKELKLLLKETANISKKSLTSVNNYKKEGPSVGRY